MVERTTSAENTQNQYSQCVHTNVDNVRIGMRSALQGVDDDEPSFSLRPVAMSPLHVSNNLQQQSLLSWPAKTY